MAAEVTDAELTSAVELLRSLIPPDEWAGYSPEHSPATVYTTLVTLWMLTLQRLGGGPSLTNVVKEMWNNHRDLLPNNKRVREETLSSASGTFSQARRRLPLATVERFAEDVCRSLIETAPGGPAGRRTYLLDGTTITLAPTSGLRKAYPPATNQHGETVWPVMLLMAAHELESGCALLPELGAMYGPERTSEAEQAAAIAGRIPPDSLVQADAGFGIFSVAWALRNAGHQILLRLTKARFKSLRRQATELERGPNGVRSRLAWKPSAKDRRAHPDLPADACLEVFLHEVELPHQEEHLFLVTSLPLDTVAAGDNYGRRYDIELDLRDFKVTLGIEHIRAKSVEMVRKELLCSVVAYNLVVQLRREAARTAGVEPRRLSFTEVWTTMQTFLLQQPPCTWSEWQVRYERAVRVAAKHKLPNRPGRSYPRRAHPRRPKSTKFMRQTPPPDLHPEPDKPK